MHLRYVISQANGAIAKICSHSPARIFVLFKATYSLSSLHLRVGVGCVVGENDV